jgi:hypothetical protein
MASENYDIIASSFPADTNEASLYEVQEGEQIVATLVVCNQTAATKTFRVAIAAKAGAAESRNWIEHDTEVQATAPTRVPIVAGPGRDIRIVAGTASSISFVLMGCRRSLT